METLGSAKKLEKSWRLRLIRSLFCRFHSGSSSHLPASRQGWRLLLFPWLGCKCSHNGNRWEMSENTNKGEIFRGTIRLCGSAHWLEGTSLLGKSATLKPPSLDLIEAWLHRALKAIPHYHLLTEISISVPGRHQMTHPKWPLTSENKPLVSHLSYRHSGLLWQNPRGGHRGLRRP